MGRPRAPEGERTVLAFDFGTVKTGVAVGNELTRLARPVKLLRARDDDHRWRLVAELLAEWQPDLVVVGRPVHSDGTALEHTKRCEKFARGLHGRHGLPVVLVDETLTSRAAEEYVRDENDDAIAAAILLEQWLSDGLGERIG